MVSSLPPARGRRHWEIYGCHLEFARRAEAWIVEERLPVFRRQIGVGWNGGLASLSVKISLAGGWSLTDVLP